jgi:hypothetical protein
MDDCHRANEAPARLVQCAWIMRRVGTATDGACVELGERAMNRKEVIDQLREIQEIADIEVAHRLADDILCRLLHSLGYADVVAEYNKVGKWFGS